MTDVDYHKLPLVEYATGAVECALARGMASHAILFSNVTYAEGGLYLQWSEIEFEVEDKEAAIKKEIALPSTLPVNRTTQPGRFGTSRSARGVYLKTIDLSEDMYEQLSDIDAVYEKATGKKFTPTVSW